MCHCVSIKTLVRMLISAHRVNQFDIRYQLAHGFYWTTCLIGVTAVSVGAVHLIFERRCHFFMYMFTASSYIFTSIIASMRSGVLLSFLVPS